MRTMERNHNWNSVYDKLTTIKGDNQKRFFVNGKQNWINYINSWTKSIPVLMQNAKVVKLIQYMKNGKKSNKDSSERNSEMK